MSAYATRLLADAARALGDEAVVAATVGDHRIASQWAKLAIKTSALLGDAVALKAVAPSGEQEQA